jgi:hypothetical protein
MMRDRVVTLILIVIAAGVAYGCASKIPHQVIPDYEKKGTRLIAVLPVHNKTQDEKAARMLRMKILDGLYFKGYPRVPLNVIDEKIAGIYRGGVDFRKENISPKTVGQLLGVDAAMYITLEKCSTSYVLVYAPTQVDARFELVSTRTGETLWSTSYGVVERIYGFTKKQLEMDSSQVFEPVIQEVVERILETIPDGPDS